MPDWDRQQGESRKVIVLAHEAARAAQAILGDATTAVRGRVSIGEHAIERMLEREQRAAHGLAWLATTVQAIRQIEGYAEARYAVGSFTELERLLVTIGLSEYLAQIVGGIPMSQSEIVRPADLGLSMAAVGGRIAGPLDGLMAAYPQRCARLVALMGQRPGTAGDCNLDETLGSIRAEMRNFA